MNNQINHKLKYLKYKEKYLQIKNMKGGHLYQDGEYMFFLTEGVDDSGKIENFNIFTNKLKCSWFLRINESNNKDVTLYPNRSNTAALIKYIPLSNDPCNKDIKINNMTKSSNQIENIKFFVNNINSQINNKIVQVIIISKRNGFSFNHAATIINKINIEYDGDEISDVKTI